MMASELIQMLLEQMARHGDCKVYIDGEEVIYPTDIVYFNKEVGSICIQ